MTSEHTEADNGSLRMVFHISQHIFVTKDTFIHGVNQQRNHNLT